MATTSIPHLLVLYVTLRTLKQLFESWLAWINRRYCQDPDHQKQAKSRLQISDDEFAKTLAYTSDKYRFGMLASWVQWFVVIVFLLAGGFGYIEALALRVSPDQGVVTGLVFFALLGLLSTLMSLPFDWYTTFCLEERHGFNRQTPRGFWADKFKMTVISLIMGGLLLAGLLYVMSLGSLWWLWAWVGVSVFSLLTSWLYPVLLAPLFNKFSPVEEGELKDGIMELARKVNFRTSGIYVMDASRRSSHGNAYFTGVFGEKRIVLFDTLIDSMAHSEVVAVLAHELGHFKLKHVRWNLVRGVLMTGFLFYALSLCLPITDFYVSFSFAGVSNYAALVVFSMWFGILDLFLSPLGSWISRQNEFAADAFAKSHMGGGAELIGALIKLRESNRSMPMAHPLYSAVYYSHPPLGERIAALGRTR